MPIPNIRDALRELAVQSTLSLQQVAASGSAPRLLQDGFFTEDSTDLGGPVFCASGVVAHVRMLGRILVLGSAALPAAAGYTRMSSIGSP